MYLITVASRNVIAAVVALFVLSGTVVTAANAQASVSPKVAAFLANPEQLLKDFPSGGALMANEVQQLVLLDPSSFGALLNLLEKANDLQKGGIGAGLAQAAKIEVLTDQAMAQDWQQRIAAIDDATFRMAATNAFGDVQIGVVGPSPLGGLGAGPAGPVGATGPATDIRSNPRATSSFTITSSTAAGPGLTITTITNNGPGPSSSTSP